jgi:hypothetical protein
MQLMIARTAIVSHSDYLRCSPSQRPGTRIIPKDRAGRKTTWSRFKTGDHHNLRMNWATSIVVA